MSEQGRLTPEAAERIRRKADRIFSDRWDVRFEPEGFLVTDPKGDCLLYVLGEGEEGDGFPVYPWVIE